MQYLSEEDDNRDVYDTLSALAHVQKLPLQDVTFGSMVATLPVVLDYRPAGLGGVGGVDGGGGGMVAGEPATLHNHLH
jgi:hypothetical protein